MTSWILESGPAGSVVLRNPDGKSLSVSARVETSAGWESGPWIAGAGGWVQRLPSGILRLESESDASGAELRLSWYHTGSAERFLRFEWRLSARGEEAGRLWIPGPWWPSTYVRPGALAEELPSRTFWGHNAPDAGWGLAVFGEAGRFHSIRPAFLADSSLRFGLEWDGGIMTFKWSDDRARVSAIGDLISSTPLLVALDPDLDTAIRRAQTSVVAEGTPAWPAEAVILEAYPAFYPGGISGLTDRLDEYRDIGFNTIYLMPHWLGGYMPIDFRQMDPAAGSADDLRRLMTEARRRGMRVLFDLVIHGLSPESDWVQDCPDLFAREADGSLMRHPTWKSVSTDWGSPAYRREMADLAAWHAQEFGFFGYRVDAAGFKGPNWDPANLRPAGEMGTLSPMVVEEMRRAMQEVEPEAIMLNEIFGPGFFPHVDASHDNQTEAVPFFLEELAAGRVRGGDYAEHLRMLKLLLPAGHVRVFYGRNHDASWFYRFGGYTPQFMALEAVHAWVGVPEVFGGDPNHGPSPDDRPGVWETYRRIFAARPGSVAGDWEVLDLADAHPDLIGVRRDSVVIVNAGHGEVDIDWPVRLTEVHRLDALEAPDAERLRLPPGGILTGRLS
ncbi:MAG: alpha-amylase family glycosyl hydrolase [Fimbriimonadaceae bacterium]|nr:alpha-amylase family glycosyl hydrolase [Fimbriimonadaceae bacterium]